MLKDQLARLQSELRLARGQSSKHDSSNSRSATPSNHKRTTIEQRSSQSQNSPSTSFTPSPAQQKPRNRSRVTRKRSSLTSENSDGLSIRLISGPGLVQTSPAFSSTEGLPTTESGYIKNAKGEWVPIRTNVSIDGDGSSGNALGQSGRKSSTDDGRGPSRIPVSAVSMGRVLAGDTAARLLGSDDEASEGATPDGSEERARADAARAVPPASHTAARRRQTRQPHPLMTLNETDGAPESSPGSACFSPGRESRSSVSQDESGVEHNQASSTSSHHVNAGRQSRTNPFFGSGGGRDRGAMIHQSHAAERALNGGNTGRVITNLQSDLLYARTALDQSKSQLRLSQRAVESLTRQTEDLKESMSRLRLENEGLSKMLARKERTVSELMERIKKSESELSTIKVEKKELDVTCKKLTKETEEIVKDSVRRRDRAETQYEAVRSGVKSLSDGWKRDVSGLKSDMQKLEEKHRKELEESRLKYNTCVYIFSQALVVRKGFSRADRRVLIVFLAMLSISQVAKLHASRSGALSKLESTLTSLQSTKDTIVKEYSIELKTLQASLKADQAESETSLLMAKEVASECARFKRMLRDYHG